MVDEPMTPSEASSVPTISELVRAHMDARGASYGDLSRRTNSELSTQALHRIVTGELRAFPDVRTLQILSKLLDLPIATILLAVASSLGLPVRQSISSLEAVLPPGSDVLTAEDREAIRTVTRALIDARRATRSTPADVDPGPIAGPEPATQYDYGLAARRGPSEGRRAREEQDRDAEA